MLETTVLFVKPGFGRWHVTEEGYEKSLAFFSSEDEALSYAIAFGRTKPGAVVRVLDERGDVQHELNIEMGPPTVS